MAKHEHEYIEEKESKRNRTREEIIASIVQTARDGTSKTKIMYINFLSYGQLQKYLNFAIDAKLIVNEDGKYITTSKGLEYLNVFEEIRNMEYSIEEKKKQLIDFLEGSENARRE